MKQLVLTKQQDQDEALEELMTFKLSPADQSELRVGYPTLISAPGKWELRFVARYRGLLVDLVTGSGSTLFTALPIIESKRSIEKRFGPLKRIEIKLACTNPGIDEDGYCAACGQYHFVETPEYDYVQKRGTKSQADITDEDWLNHLEGDLGPRRKGKWRGGWNNLP